MHDVDERQFLSTMDRDLRGGCPIEIDGLRRKMYVCQLRTLVQVFHLSLISV